MHTLSRSRASDAPHATTIVVKSLTSGDTVRTIKSDVIVDDLDLSAGNVAYIEGKANAGDPYDPVDPTWLMLSTVDQPTPVRIADNVDGLSFSDGRLAWGTTDEWANRNT